MSSPTQKMEPFIWNIRVYYEDTDSGGVVYHANYLKFMERARTEWLRSVGVEQDQLLIREKVIFAVRSANIDYKKSARFNDALVVVSRLPHIRNVSFTFEHKIYLQDEYANEGEAATLLCSGIVKVASLDGETFKPKTIPSNLIMELQGAN